LIGLVTFAVLFDSQTALAQQSSNACVGCHIAPKAVLTEWWEAQAAHVVLWQQSAHGQAQVTCDKCHGGAPNTLDLQAAHVGLLSPRNPASPVHRANQPVTCGQCHAGPWMAFRDSTHARMLVRGDRDAPTCSTCHGSMAVRRVAADLVRYTCASCHREDGSVPPAPATAYLADMRRLIDELRLQLDAAERLLARVDDPRRHSSIAAELRDAHEQLKRASEGWHAFKRDDAVRQVNAAAETIIGALSALANR
jgi:hypothetical protein